MKKLISNVWGILDDFISMFYPKLCEVCKEPLFKNEDEVCLYCRYKFPWNISDKELEKLVEESDELKEFEK